MHQGSVVLFCLHIIASLYMFGIIWFVQVVHYPLFTLLPPEADKRSFSEHQKRTSYVVIPGMILELGTAIWLLFHPFPNLFSVIILLALSLAPLIATFLLQVPCHRALLKEHHESTIKRLVRTNWLRTWLWTLKAIYLFTLLWILL